MKIIKVYILEGQPYSAPLSYTLDLVMQHQGVDMIYVGQAADADWVLDHTSEGSLYIHQHFYEMLDEGNYDGLKYKHGQVRGEGGQVDRLASIFYMVNCLQELNPMDRDLDKYGRFRYQASYQFEDNNITQNLVQDLIDSFLSDRGIQPRVWKSKIFISHDIDFLYGSRSEDLKWAMRTFSLGKMLKIIFNEVAGKPHWRNIDRVMAINDAHDIRSTFFWLVNKGIGEDGVLNADYDLRKEKDLIQLIDAKNGINGLHKSASTETIDQEVIKSGNDWICNRYHYLKFQTHQSWTDLSNSKIKLDCSLGFAEHYGFRNSYGMPFRPYDLEHKCAYDFTVAPLHIMDATFEHYLHQDAASIAPTIIDFMDKQKTNCVLSILWHNNYCTDYAYRDYLRAYQAILEYIKDEHLTTVHAEELIISS